MSGEMKHYYSQVKFIVENSFRRLEDSINEFCKGKWVVGIQYPDVFQRVNFTAIVSYKLLEE